MYLLRLDFVGNFIYILTYDHLYSYLKKKTSQARKQHPARLSWKIL